MAWLALVSALAAAVPYADGRDPWSLLYAGLVNRQLALQLESPRTLGLYPERPPLELPGPLAFALDGSVGHQSPIGPGEQTRFHAFFVLDAYLELQVLDGLRLNYNVTAFNPSASDGYRASADLIHGLAVHLYGPLGTLDGDPVRGDLVVMDLDMVTLGRGLLIEALPSEGFLAGLRWREAEARFSFLGRTLFRDDNILAAELSGWERRLGLGLVAWFSDDIFSARPDPEATPQPEGPFDPFQSWYATAFGELPLRDDLRLAGEYSLRLDGGRPTSGLLLRGDYLLDRPSFDLHLGYQFRFYERGFGPRTKLVAPTQTPNTPRREEVYVTNSFEYLGISPVFHQWSHTVMSELFWELFGRVTLFVSLEWWLRFVRAAEEAPQVVYDARFGRYPDVKNELFYRGGFLWRPFAGAPHRVSAYVTNKAVVSFDRVVFATPFRFSHADFFFIEGEFFL